MVQYSNLSVTMSAAVEVVGFGQLSRFSMQTAPHRNHAAASPCLHG